MTTTTTEAALLRAIAAHPDEDTPRGMYADWLDDDQPERAEFIRLQIALAWPDSELPRCVACNGTKRITAMAYPEAAYDPEPHEVETDCKACVCRKKYVNTGTNRNAMTARVSALWHGGVSSQFATNAIRAAVVNPPSAFTDHDPVLLVTRGFAETLYLPTLADLCERERLTCSACDGKGYFFTKDHGIFSRQGHNICADCLTCHGTRYTIGDYTGKPTKLALDTMRAHPTITRVVVGDVIRRNVLNLRDFPRYLIQEWERFDEGEMELPTAMAICLGQWLRQEAGI